MPSLVAAVTLPASEATFPPMYYDSPVNQMVLGIEVPSDDGLTAAITAGAPYFKVSAIDVSNWIVDPPVVRPPALPGGLPTKVTGVPLTAAPLAPTVPTRHLSAPVSNSNGINPLVVKQGQYARLWITADVPKGAALPPGAFTGTVVLKGKTTTKTVTLKGTYLGTVMGKVTVQPATVVPGQPVLVQVCDASGKPLSDPAVKVTIQGVPASALYYQFPTVGNRNLVVRAVRGALSETTQATVVVAGAPLAFRQSLTLPTVTTIPMLQVAAVAGQPYAATFTLGPTGGFRRVLA